MIAKTIEEALLAACEEHGKEAAPPLWTDFLFDEEILGDASLGPDEPDPSYALEPIVF
jgi:hypothetical protein